MNELTLAVNRICFISPSAFSYFEPDTSLAMGGAERQIYLLSQRLSERYNIQVVVGDFGQPKKVDYQNVTLQRGHQTGPVNSIKKLKKPIDLFAAMRRSQADLFICRNPPKLASITSIISRLLDVPWIYHIANDAYINSPPQNVSNPFQLAFRNAIRKSDTVISQTNNQKELLRQSYGKDSIVVPNGYPSVESNVSINRRSKFIWVGRFDKKQKRPHLYLDIAEDLPQYKFELIGDGKINHKYTEKIKERAKNIKNVDYRGMVAPDEIYKNYQEAYALINTSAYEGFPNTFLEAWRCKTPVLSLKVNPNRFVETTPNQPYPNGSVDDLIKIADKVATSVSYRREIGKSVYQFFKQNYLIDQVSKKYISVIENVL